jgi:hypothetical protein
VSKKSDRVLNRFGEIDASRKPEFIGIGIKGRYFFPHRIHHLPKCGPDGYKLAQWMCDEQDPNVQSELILYATPELAAQFPDDLWFDEDLLWHEQHFGRTGQVASANLCARGHDLYSMVFVSDLVQRISRRPAEKSRIENRFKGWPAMLINAILTRAADHDFERVFVPRSRWAMKHTDPNRTVQPELFERIYDKSVSTYSPEVTENWWVIDIQKNRHLVVVPVPRHETFKNEKIICIYHDIERGLGHVDCDPGFAAIADESSPKHLTQMANIEKAAGVRATYNVVGCLMSEVAPEVKALGHEVAFHSYNHIISEDQLSLCRSVDYRIKGYRPPQSRLTDELTESALCFHNFEWLASSAYSLGFDQPKVENRLVKIPALLDDWPMYSKGMAYEEWHNEVLQEIESAQFAAIGLHDCYAGYWLAHYAELLSELQEMGTFMTLNQVAARTSFANSLEPSEPWPLPGL